jgi:hypothetical protein
LDSARIDRPVTALVSDLGIDASKFSVPYQGLNQRLIGPQDGWRVREDLFA